MIIKKSNYFSFDKYRTLFCKVTRLHPFEINYQSFIIMPVLDQVFKKDNLDIVNVSNFRLGGTDLHSTNEYAGEMGQPDILVAKNFIYNNKTNKKNKILITIEVKNPTNKIHQQPSGKIAFSKENKTCINQLESHLSKNKKVLLTNCEFWAFSDKDVSVDIPVRVFNLDLNVEEVQKNRNEIISKEQDREWISLLKYLYDFAY